jgi:hypothetical protein
MCKKIKNPNQWVYVIEKCSNQVKIGVSRNYIERIKCLERIGGFRASRYLALGPYQNGYEVESKILDRLKKFRFIGEWHLVSYEDAVATVKEVAKEIGNFDVIETLDTKNLGELVDDLYPLKASLTNDGNLQDAVITGFVDEKSVLWLETDECGMFLPEFLMGFLRIEELLRGGKSYGHK